MNVRNNLKIATVLLPAFSAVFMFILNYASCEFKEFNTMQL